MKPALGLSNRIGNRCPKTTDSEVLVKVFALKRLGLAALIILALLAIGLELVRLESVWLFHRTDLRNANELIARVEAYRENHGRLPETLEEVGITDPDLHVYYRKASADEYLVWFGRYSLGESVTYSSRTKKWDY